MFIDKLDDALLNLIKDRTCTASNQIWLHNISVFEQHQHQPATTTMSDNVGFVDAETHRLINDDGAARMERPPVMTTYSLVSFFASLALLCASIVFAIARPDTMTYIIPFWTGLAGYWTPSPFQQSAVKSIFDEFEDNVTRLRRNAPTIVPV